MSEFMDLMKELEGWYRIKLDEKGRRYKKRFLFCFSNSSIFCQFH